MRLAQPCFQIEEDMKKETVGILEMLLCAALWSIAGIFMKLLPWNGFAVASLRSLVAGLIIASVIVNDLTGQCPRTMIPDNAPAQTLA